MELQHGHLTVFAPNVKFAKNHFRSFLGGGIIAGSVEDLSVILAPMLGILLVAIRIKSKEYAQCATQTTWTKKSGSKKNN